MKRTAQLFLAIAATLFASGLALAATPPTSKSPDSKPAAPPPLSPRFIQVRERINTLFQHRNEVPPPPDLRANPFRPAGAAVVPGATSPTLPSNDLSLLQQAIATLKVSGTVERDEQSYVVVNNRTYKKGDVVPARAEGEMVYLRVGDITRNTLTLTLNSAELTLKF
jgi:hypothetical protein